jgi:hypothetical protein
MATHHSKYLSDAILNVARGTTFPTVPANFYVALFTTMPTKADMTGAVEPSGDGYARQALATSTASWGAPATQGDNITEQIALTPVITFPADTTANWGTILGFALYDAVTVGNCWIYGTLTANQVVNVGNQLQFNAAGITWSES